MKRIHALLAIAVLCTGGCFWLQGESHETDSLPDQKPRSIPRQPDVGPKAGGALQEPLLPSIDPSTVPTVDAPNWNALVPQFSVWVGGLRSASAQINGPIAYLRITVAHKRSEGPYSLLGRLTAELVAEAPRDGGTRPSLHQRITELGGDFDITVGLGVTHFDVVVLAGRLPAALTALAECLSEAPTTSERVDVFRDRLVRRFTEQWADRPLDVAVDRVLGIELRGLGDWLAKLEDATAIDVGLFHRENYSPERILVSLASNLDSGPATNAAIATAFTKWLGKKPALIPEVATLPPPAAGAFWSPAELAPRVAIVLELPTVHTPGGPLQLLAAEYLGGPGGVVERAVRKVMPDLGRIERTVRSDGLRRQLQLEFAAPTEQIEALWNGVKSAYVDAARKRPGLQELAAAAARTRVMLGEQFREPLPIVAMLARANVVGAAPAHVVGLDGRDTVTVDTSKPWRVALRALDQPETIDLGPTLGALAARTPLFIVVGGNLDQLARRDFFVEVPGATLPETRREAVSAEVKAQEAAAKQYLALAVRAVSGGVPSIQVPGFRSTSVTRSGRGPEVADIELFQPDGSYRRQRNVLATSVETTIDRKGASERCGAEIRRPDPDEVASVLAPLRRHPLLLLAEWSTGKSNYRLISKREHDGRELAVLERLQDGGEPLRLMVDVETGLVRVVTYHEDRPNGRVYVRDEWRNYRDVGGGVRAPHHRTTFFDDGNHGLVTIWMELKLQKPSAESLAPGGPLR